MRVRESPLGAPSGATICRMPRGTSLLLAQVFRPEEMVMGVLASPVGVDEKVGVPAQEACESQGWPTRQPTEMPDLGSGPP